MGILELLLKILRVLFLVIDKFISFTTQTIAVVGIAGGVALAFYNVVARYIFKSSLTWAGELTVYLFLWSAFFGAVYCFKKDAHISISLLLDKSPPIVSKSLIILSYSITAIFLLAVAWYGYEYIELVIELEERSTDLDIPMWIPYLVIPLSFAFGAWEVGKKLISTIKTPAKDIKKESEAQMILEEFGDETRERLIKDARGKRGGVL